MLIHKKEVGSFAANCYLAACGETREAVLIDPGAQAELILAMVAKEDVSVKYIINTHGHVDHVGANDQVRQALGIPVLIHEHDSDFYRQPAASLSFFLGDIQLLAPDRLLKGGEKLAVGTLLFEVIETPGHTRGCITLRAGNVLFTGDTLFAESIGRTDLPGGSFQQIMDSIKQKILIFPDDTVICPGHGPESTIGRVKKENSFLR